MTFFLKEIYEKRTRKNDKEFAENLKRYRRAVPTFSILKAMIDTIRELEIYFMYDNSPASNIYTPGLNKKGMPQGSILVVDCDTMTITIKLETLQDIDEIQEITDITIKRKLGTQIETRLKYKNDDADTYIHTKEDMMLYGLVEERIMTTFCDLLEYYYYNGPHRLIDPDLLYK